MTPRKTSRLPAGAPTNAAGKGPRPPRVAPLAGETPAPEGVTPVSPASPPSRDPEGSARKGGAEASGGRPGASPGRPPGIQMSAVVQTGEHTWSLYFPPGMELLNSNQRLHWSRKGAITKRLRTAAWALAKNKVPALDRVRIVIEYQAPKMIRTRDAGNWSPTGKALIDGLRDAKVLANDDSEHVLEEAYRIGQPTPFGRIVMHITEVPDGEA